MKHVSGNHTIHMWRYLLSLVLLLLCAPQAWGVEFSLPIRCDYGQDCFIQNYVDIDPTPAWADHGGGFLSYDGHKGTDFRVPWADYLRGVEVVAAADGVVLTTRDGYPDQDARDHREAVRGREAGNAVVVDHGGGFEAMYIHLKRGSVRVKSGDRVRRGQVLGLVGLSGFTTFPHLHFGVRYQGGVVCPFKGVAGDASDRRTDANSLWTPETGQQLRYLPTGLIRAGFYDTKPAMPDAVRDPLATVIAADAPVLAFGVTVFGIRKGDVLRMRIIMPDGRIFREASPTMEKNKAHWLAYAGRRLAQGKRWLRGIYTGNYELIRDQVVILTVTRTVEVR